MILLCKALYRAFAVFVQSSLQVVCHAGVQDSISFVGQKVDIILFHILTAFLGVEFAEAFLLSERVLRDCHVGLRPPRNDKSGGQHCFNGGRYGSGVPSRDCHVASLLAMTNRRCVPFYDGSFRTAVPSRDCHVGLRPPRNDKSGGQHCFNGGRYGSGVPSRDCHVASLLAMTNRRCVPFLRWLVPNGSTYLRLPRRFAPRNDKSGSRYDQLILPRILRFPPYWKSPRRR